MGMSEYRAAADPSTTTRSCVRWDPLQKLKVKHEPSETIIVNVAPLTAFTTGTPSAGKRKSSCSVPNPDGERCKRDLSTSLLNRLLGTILESHRKRQLSLVPSL